MISRPSLAKIAVRESRRKVKTVKSLFALMALVTLSPVVLWAGPLEALAERVTPKLAGRVTFRVDPKRQDIAVSPVGKDGIAIAAPNTRLAAAGLGCYLREVAQAHWSWCGNRLDGEMPAPPRTLTFTPAFPHTQAYNYCTLSYTMAFWDETAWREEIDRLALYGFEFPLVQAGLGKVWQGVLRELGYPEERIAAFIPDEAAAAWWNMGNLEGLGGPLSQARVDRDAAVGRFLVQEMQALGMKPILQGFTGLVPSDLPKYLDKKAFPDARFVEQGHWVDGFQRPILLDPTTDAFQKIAALWYKHLFLVYGVSRAEAFGGDLFHEGGRTGGLNVEACARAVQTAQQKASPGAIWMIQAWGANPRQELLKGLDPRYAMILALVRDQTNGHRYPRSFANVPWLWCELLNFGGNHGLYGGLRVQADLGELTAQPGAKTLSGYGLLSEGLEMNPVFYELFTQRFFMPKDLQLGAAGLNAWLSDYATRRYGQCTPEITRALRLLAVSAYAPIREQEGCTESIYCARPSWTARKASSWSSGEQYYPPADTLRAAETLLTAADRNPDLLQEETFAYDLADVTRQALADLGRPLLSLAKDSPAARKAFLEAIRRTDAVLACVPRWRLDFCEARTRNVGGEAGPRGYRRMITTWSGRRGALNDYANRQLAGLLSGYYLKRWETFFADPTPKNLDARLAAIDAAFIDKGAPLPPANGSDLARTVREALRFARGTHERWPTAFLFAKGVPWDLGGVKGSVTLRHSVSDFVTQAGTYRVEIQWQRGNNALKIEKVELFEGERCVASDVHPGYAGVRREANVYTLRLPTYRTSLEDYTLRITGSGDGGGQSAGVFTILPVGAPDQK